MPQPGTGPQVTAVWAADGPGSTGTFHDARGHGSDTAYPARNIAAPHGTLTLSPVADQTSALPVRSAAGWLISSRSAPLSGGPPPDPYVPVARSAATPCPGGTEVLASAVTDGGVRGHWAISVVIASGQGTRAAWVVGGHAVPHMKSSNDPGSLAE